jgi:hypothetical protein
MEQVLDLSFLLNEKKEFQKQYLVKKKQDVLRRANRLFTKPLTCNDRIDKNTHRLVGGTYEVGR